MRHNRSRWAERAALALLLATPWVWGDPPDLADVRHRVKPEDGNLWSQLYAHGAPVSGVPPHRRCLSFTFDDGPDADLTPRLLDMLDAHHIRATFFVLGSHLDGGSERADRNRAVLRDAWSRGHLIGNHSYHHRVLDRMDAPTLNYEIDRTAALIRDVIGERTWLFRAPFGAIDNPRARGAVLGRGYTLVRWSIDPRDWEQPDAASIVRNFRARLDHAPEGGIVLLHDVRPYTIAAFPRLLDEVAHRNDVLRARSERPYEIVGLEEFFRSTHEPR